MQSRPDTTVAVFNWIAEAMLNTKGAMYQLLTKLTGNAEKDGSDGAQNIRRLKTTIWSQRSIFYFVTIHAFLSRLLTLMLCNTI